MTNLIGKSLGRYHILEQLGEGGMATVYKAYDTRLEADVAVKVIRTENLAPSVLERALKRFEREAKSLARLTHANIVKVTDYGEYDGKPFLVMVYLPSGTLKEKLGRPIPWRDAVRLLLPIVRALAYAHEKGTVHRDVKPSNILITHSGDPMLTDFGIAKIIDEESTLDLTGTSAAIGTPEYMAPEQVTAKTVDHRADIYALGIVLYEMITGRKPFMADTPMAVLFKHTSDPLPRPTQFVSDLPVNVENILIKALAKRPENRFSNMTAFVTALETAMETQSNISHAKARTDSYNQAKPISLAGSLFGKWSGRLLVFFIVALLVMMFAGMLSSRMGEIFSIGQSKPNNEMEITISQSKPQPSMIKIPAGEFTMGSRNSNENEQPVRKIKLDEFWVDQFEVTNSQYQVCVEAGDCDPPVKFNTRSIAEYYGNSEYGNYPVVNVTWNMANDFCTWRGGRLPTEAEWEKAARGADQRNYPWGNEFNCNFANALGCKQELSMVGSYDLGVSPYNVYDMAGNASEWVADWYQETYPNRVEVNPTGPSAGIYRVVRGGFYTSSREDVRTTKRFFIRETVSYYYLGFRCAADQAP